MLFTQVCNFFQTIIAKDKVTVYTLNTIPEHSDAYSLYVISIHSIEQTVPIFDSL